MKTRKEKKSEGALRRRAEKRLERVPEEPIPTSKSAMLRMLHELRVHRVELEVQNEELRHIVEAHLDWERRLAESEAQYRAVTETTADGFWMIDTRGRILVVNDAYLRRSGYSREELLGTSIADLEATESSEEVCAHMEKVRRNGSDLFESQHRAKDGSLWPVEINAAYWEAAGGHLFVFVRDITERKEAELALRESELRLAAAEDYERRRLAEDLHDDLGQLMAVIKLKIGEMMALRLTPEQEEAASECARVVDLANRKMRSMTFQLSPPMLDELGLLASIQWLADEMRYFYKLDVLVEDDGFPKSLDPVLNAPLFRVIRELLINVAKHARVDKATVKLAMDDKRRLAVNVSDAGIGFVEGGMARENGMAGYGLLSVRQRLRQMGGEMRIVSVPNEGTSVTLSVPLRAAKTVMGAGHGEKRP
jgi:PAS domain S-box-containing protein